jgi:hypothetical protein
MPELTLESLAARVAELEREVVALKGRPPSVIPPSRDWRSVIGISEESDFSRAMQAEMDALREAERRAALEEGGS